MLTLLQLHTERATFWMKTLSFRERKMVWKLELRSGREHKTRTGQVKCVFDVESIP